MASAAGQAQPSEPPADRQATDSPVSPPVSPPAGGSDRPLRDRQLLARIFGYVRPHMRVFAVGVLGMILTAATEPALPALFKVLLDDGFGKQGSNWLVWALPVAMVLGLALVITGVADIIGGNAPLIGETAHLPELCSVLLLWLLASSIGRDRNTSSIGGHQPPILHVVERLDDTA